MTMSRFLTGAYGQFSSGSSRSGSGKQSSEIPSLNGIRALAVTMVVLLHTGMTKSPAGLGVTLFFFLSGYLITTLLRMEFDRTGSIDLRAFYIRRAFRILPPLYAVLIVADLLTLGGGFVNAHLRLGGCLSQFFFFSNYQINAAGWYGPHIGRAPGTEQLWSLAIEEHFYLLFPFIYLLLRRYLPSPRRQAAVLAGICSAVLLWRFIFVLGLHASESRVYAGTDTRIDGILFGCILAVLGNPVLDRKLAGEETWLSRWWPTLLAPPALVAILLVGTDFPGPAVLRSVLVVRVLQYTIEGLAFFPLFVLAIRNPTWGVFKFLNARAVVFLGIMSYSIYISHNLVIWYFRENMGGGHITRGLFYLVVIVFVGWVMLRFIEGPSTRLKKRFTRATGRPASATDTPRGSRGVVAPAHRNAERPIPLVPEPAPAIPVE
jgi:peptidoglycan/LPS O-acetylase OafA/YrhL